MRPDEHMKVLTRFVLLLVLLAFAVSSFYLYGSSSHGLKVKGSLSPESQNHPDKAILRNNFLTEEQCSATFPGLFKEIDRAVAFGKFELKKEPEDYSGAVQGRIKGGKLYIISSQQDNVLRRVGAILHSLHRAIITSPEPLPDTTFILSINDDPRSKVWCFSRSNDDFIPQNPWIMPHFSTWSWPLEYLGPLDQALEKINKIEERTPYETKIDKAVWRGTPWFNPLWDIGLRPKLIEATKEKEWADVEIWNKDSGNTIPITDMCKYKYIIYAEGKSYSGRLPYHQACASVIITTPLTFLMHHTHLLQPVFSSTLLDISSEHRVFPSKHAYPTPSTNATWPVSYPPSLANVVFVKPNWSDLEATIQWLRDNPKVAKGIAHRQRDLMVGGGYLSEAAEACYWRKFIRAWSEMAMLDPPDEQWGEGMRFETFTLTGNVKGFVD